MRLTVECNQFSKEDVRCLLQAIRDCEQSAFPEKELIVSIVVPELTVEECKDLLGSIRPPYGLGPVTVEFGKENLGAV